jgi:lantibiotic biosynthesis protein
MKSYFDLPLIENTQLEQYIYDAYLLNCEKNDSKNLEKVNEIIFKKGVELAESGNIEFWNGASMSLNYFCHFGNSAENKEIKILTSIIMQAFWKVYHNDPLKLNLKDGILGILISLCQSYRILKWDEIHELIERASNELGLLKKTTNIDDEFLNIFPSYYERSSEEVVFDNDLSWNSGNLTMALLMYNLGLCIDESYTDWAHRLVGFSLTQTIEKISNLENSLTTGIPGNILMYDFFYSVFKDEKIKEAVNYWKKQSNDLKIINQNIDIDAKGLEELFNVEFLQNALIIDKKDWVKLLLIG